MEPPARPPQRNSIAANQWDAQHPTLAAARTTQKQGELRRRTILLRQRNERIDQLTAQVDQLREHSRHADEKAEHMAMFVGLMLDLNDAAAAKQSVACVIG